ncbi:MAG: hypothetical protein RL038_521 [Actinomycetota bacterium]
MFLMELNWLAVLAGFLVFFVTGAVWFGPKTFYPAWVKALGQDPAVQIEHTPPGVLFGLTAVGGLVQVIAMASVLGFVAESVSPLQGAWVGFLLSSSLVAAGSLSHRLFAGQGLKVWIIEVGGDVVGLTLAGLVFGLIA